MKVAAPLLLILMTSTAFAGSETNLRTLIQARYDKITRLSTQLDKRGLEKTILRNSTSNFEYIDLMKNSFDLGATVRQNTEQLDQVLKFTSNANRIKKFVRQGRDVVCEVETSYDIVTRGRVHNKISGVSVSEDTWTPTIAGWKIIRSRAIKETIFKNGRPMKPTI